jgi:hypothetical protein
VIEVAIRSLLEADAQRTFDLAADHIIEFGFEAVACRCARRVIS